ncbi:MAG: hypothetical protein U0103_11525 [Candidatus Obscuribacterales bacterium]
MSNSPLIDQKAMGLIKRETSAKVFDTQGQPILLGKSFAYENRVSGFTPQDTYKGKDMKKAVSRVPTIE